MAKIISTGYIDSAISGVTSLPFARALINFVQDFRVKENTPANAIAVNLTSPVDRTEKFQWAYTEVKDTYANTGIDASAYAASRKGIKVLCKVSDIWSVTDTVDADYRVDLPVSAHIVLTLPQSEYITSDMLLTLTARAVSGLFDTGSLTTERISGLVKGSLLPTGL